MAEQDEILMKALVKNAIPKESKSEHMNTEEPETAWTLAEENVLILEREREWAEAYAADRPQCRMGRLYLDFLRWELVTTQAEL